MRSLLTGPSILFAIEHLAVAAALMFSCQSFRRSTDGSTCARHALFAGINHEGRVIRPRIMVHRPITDRHDMRNFST
ncbi:hypothetical protein B0H10DRAFT_42683 [Mycena sp. CBHHK59/15]|nr:hypothetical protein B0H10DRAFT_42683 [Mycena sp. CBHHK59/15]